MLVLLSACDCADRPASPVKPTPASAPTAQPKTPVQTPQQVAEPLVEPETSFKPEIQLPPPPEPEPKAQAEPLKPVVQAPPPQLKKPEAPKRRVSQPTRTPPPVAVPAEPKAPLDLSLPEALLGTLQPLDTSAEMDSALLPPMFNENPDENPYQLNGRLITRERQDEIEGAELRIEFKR